MDRLDRIALLALVAIILAVSGLFVGHRHTGEKQAVKKARVSEPQMVDPDLGKKLNIARDLLLAGNPGKAKGLLDMLQHRFPYDGRVYMLLGDYYIHRQQPIQAMLEHRKAIELNPDFLDKNTAVFQGKVIKNNVKEAQALIEAGLQREPQNEKWQKYKEAMYYMQRRIAGSCN